MTIWDYHTVVLPEDAEEAKGVLSNWGSGRWELASVDKGIAYLKRPADEERIERGFDEMFYRVIGLPM